MANQQFVKVEIFNQTYRLRCDEADSEYIVRAADYLDEKMRQASATGARKPLDVAILAAMNLAEEVLASRQKQTDLVNQADQRIDNFARLLDDHEDKPPTSENSSDSDSPPRF